MFVSAEGLGNESGKIPWARSVSAALAKRLWPQSQTRWLGLTHVNMLCAHSGSRDRLVLLSMVAKLKSMLFSLHNFRTVTKCLPKTSEAGWSSDGRSLSKIWLRANRFEDFILCIVICMANWYLDLSPPLHDEPQTRSLRCGNSRWEESALVNSKQWLNASKSWLLFGKNSPIRELLTTKNNSITLK